MKTNTLIWLFVTMFSFSAISCENLFQTDDKVNIRIQNASSFKMDSLLVIFWEDEILYDEIESGASTSYKTVSKAYRYAYIETKIDGNTSVLQPIDFVGESPLKPGNYTYILNVIHPEETRYSLTLELRKD